MSERKSVVRKGFFMGISMFLLVLMLAVPAQAAKKYRKGFVKQRYSYCYYNEKGKKVKGLTKIGKKYYYFDEKGRQRTGWQQIGSEYYFFQIVNGKYGYMVTSSTVNGITLGKSGKASQSSSSLRRLKLLVKATQTVEEITNPLMTQVEKLKICFNYVKKYGYTTWRKFRNYTGWELDYAEDMFYRGKGNCFSYAASFAFLANAVGAKNVYVISSGGHGWAEIEGKVYDPDWTFVSSVDSYFGMSYSLSGVGGRPLYASNRVYAAKI